ncbi:MAG: DUF4140 domain-containing protein [Flavobacteriales bacterium]|nr:MAG: DUF4140 domain-containing protein [Flavobacteriales bacterium]
MKKCLLILTLFFTSVLVQAQENQIVVNSKISNVTVFISGAQVFRNTEQVDLPQGVSLLVFSGLSSAIETQSIQAKGEGNFTILSVTQQKNFLLEKKNSELKSNERSYYIYNRPRRRYPLYTGPYRYGHEHYGSGARL